MSLISFVRKGYSERGLLLSTSRKKRSLGTRFWYSGIILGIGLGKIALRLFSNFLRGILGSLVTDDEYLRIWARLWSFQWVFVLIATVFVWLCWLSGIYFRERWEEWRDRRFNDATAK